MEDVESEFSFGQTDQGSGEPDAIEVALDVESFKIGLSTELAKSEKSLKKLNKDKDFFTWVTLYQVLGISAGSNFLNFHHISNQS